METGHQGPQLQPFRPHAAADQPAPERARHDGQDRVVHRAAQRVLDLLEVGQAAAHPPHPPVGADLHVQRDIGRRVQPGPDHLAQALGALAHLLEGAPGPLKGAQRRPAKQGPGPMRLDALEHQVGVRGHGLGDPVLVLDLRGPGLEVEQHSGDVHAGDAVDERVMCLGDQGEAAALEALDEPQLPEGFERSRRWEKMRPTS